MFDLYQVRRDLIAMRSMHSANRSATQLINKLLGKIAHVREPKSPKHEKKLQQLVEKVTNELNAR
jgi:hypothetical protein